MRQIIVEYGVNTEIMAALGCTQPTIRAALRYKSNTPLARKIRFLALKKGGVAKESGDRRTAIAAIVSIGSMK